MQMKDIMDSSVTIIITEVEAKAWKDFQKNYETFMLLVNSGVFEVKNGSIALHFDAKGDLQLIQRADQLYKRSSSVS